MSRFQGFRACSGLARASGLAFWSEFIGGGGGKLKMGLRLLE